MICTFVQIHPIYVYPYKQTFPWYYYFLLCDKFSGLSFIKAIIVELMEVEFGRVPKSTILLEMESLDGKLLCMNMNLLQIHFYFGWGNDQAF
jgi:hypothetical protein